MTSKVAIQVDRLAQLVDDSIVSVPSVPTLENENVSPSDPLKKESVSPTPFPSDPAASSSSSLSSSQDLESSIDNTNKTFDLTSSPQGQSSKSTLRLDSCCESSGKSSTATGVKKRKMDFLDDSGIPMDGIELDSSTTPNRISHHLLASTTTINSLSSASNLASSIRTSAATASGQKTLRDVSPSLTFDDECKPAGTGGSCSPDHGIIPTDNQEDDNCAQQAENRNQSNSCRLRGFGHLFDDEDLD